MKGETFNYYHLYLRGNNHQSIFLDTSDFINAMNRLAIAALMKNTNILASDFLTNHYHLIVYTADPGGFMHYFRKSYSYYFNKKYNSIGNVGTRKYGKGLIIDPEADGGDDLRDKICYVLRNPLWHSIQTDFRMYPWSTARLYYNKPVKTQLIDPALESAFLPGDVFLPKGYIMLENGLISPYCYHDTATVEKLFGSYSNFIDRTSVPSTVEIESTSKKKAKEELTNRKKNKTLARTEVLNRDIEISEYIVHTLLPSMDKTIPMLNQKEKIEIAHKVHTHFPNAYRRQIARILLIPESTLRRKC